LIKLRGVQYFIILSFLTRFKDISRTSHQNKHEETVSFLIENCFLFYNFFKTQIGENKHNHVYCNGKFCEALRGKFKLRKPGLDLD